MEYNRNKIILFIVWWILIFFIVVMLIIMLFNQKSREKKTANNENFTIWMVWDSAERSTDLIDGFKKFSKTKKDVVIESFNNYEEYSYALTNAIANGTAPDVFVLNSNEKESIFQWQTTWIEPDIVNPNSFRKDYKTFLSDQLIAKTDKWVDYLVWIDTKFCEYFIPEGL